MGEWQGELSQGDKESYNRIPQRKYAGIPNVRNPLRIHSAPKTAILRRHFPDLHDLTVVAVQPLNILPSSLLEVEALLLAPCFYSTLGSPF